MDSGINAKFFPKMKKTGRDQYFPLWEGGKHRTS
jgi:hypothetical protein